MERGGEGGWNRWFHESREHSDNDHDLFHKNHHCYKNLLQNNIGIV